jgi:hypothetical protein
MSNLKRIGGSLFFEQICTSASLIPIRANLLLHVRIKRFTREGAIAQRPGQWGLPPLSHIIQYRSNVLLDFSFPIGKARGLLTTTGVVQHEVMPVSHSSKAVLRWHR